MAGLTGFHYFSVTDSNCDQQKFWATKSLAGFFDVLSTNRDRNGLEFISTIEGTALPIQSVNLLFPMKCTCWSIASLNHKITGKTIKTKIKKHRSLTGILFICCLEFVHMSASSY